MSAGRRHVIVGGQPARAFAQSLFKRGRPLIFAEQVGEGFLGQVLHVPAGILGEQFERQPDFGREFDQLAFDGIRVGAGEHAPSISDSRSLQAERRWAETGASGTMTRKRARPRAIVQGRVHDPHFAVERYRQPARLGADRGLGQLERVEVARAWSMWPKQSRHTIQKNPSGVRGLTT